MATGTRIYQINLGVTTPATDSTIILGSGSTGTVGARRRLTHPVSASFPELIYARNPDRWWNIDNDVVPTPIVQTVLTETSTRVVRHERGLIDTPITETWTTDRGKASMEASFLRQLLEYLANPPAFSATAQTYITYEPRDLNSFTYNVEFLKITVGSGRDGAELEFTQTRMPSDNTIAHALDQLDTTPNGLVRQPVSVVMLPVSKV